MAESQLVASHRADAEIFHGEVCKERIQKLLEDFSLPKGLLPLENFEEMGFNRSSGFLWLKQKKKQAHKFKGTSNTVMYEPVITAFVEDRRLQKVTGVKSKVLLVAVKISDMFIEDPASGMISFGTSIGISRGHPISTFELEDENGDAQNSEN
ncbi:hypothetical protein RJ640_009747 [Escallonia rubra]|uniref:Uncharacterized protein n=1 Tax=Escallonia rubra TaxID=112253 RepID=A0AA88SDU9_9ASTE|nr:hypothetical protein RJ640_000952 [Escallonia rubra]KAK2987625.1 hypothetical protein RJ640_009747 [Escallonia rubra]